MKKKLRYLLIVALLFSCIPAMSSEASSSKAHVQKVVKNFYLYSKKMNTTKMKTCVYKGKLKYTDAVFKSYSKKYNKKLNVSIQSTKVSKKTATVKAKVKYQSLYNAYYNAFGDLIIWTIFNDEATDAQMLKKFKAYFNAEVKEYEPKTKTKTVTIKLVKASGKWKIKSVTNSMYNTIHCDAIKAFSDIEKTLSED